MQNVQKPQILACIPPDANWPVVSNGIRCAFSPVSCLKETENSDYDFIVVFFGDVPLKSRSALTELCLALKKSPDSQIASVVAVMRHGHRRLIRTLVDGGVEFIKIAMPEEDGETDIAGLVDDLSDDNRSGFVITRFCPFINYRPISRRREMLTCGAYRDRLVLGAPRLSRFCEVGKYEECEYYQNPKIRRKRKTVPFFKTRNAMNRKRIAGNPHE